MPRTEGNAVPLTRSALIMLSMNVVAANPARPRGPGSAGATSGGGARGALALLAHFGGGRPWLGLTGPPRGRIAALPAAREQVGDREQPEDLDQQRGRAPDQQQ